MWAENNRNRSASENPWSGEIHRVLASGSLEGEGKKAAQPQNLGSSCGLMPEGEKWMSWCLAEGQVNRSIVVEVCERAMWHWYTAMADRSFSVQFAYFCVGGALHLQDVASLFCGNDPVGLRGRLTSYYSRPSFKRARSICEANDELENTGYLSEMIARVFCRVAKAHSPDIAGLGAFRTYLTYPFREYTLTAEVGSGSIVETIVFVPFNFCPMLQAYRKFEERIHHHVTPQEAAHLRDQEEAKFHGKAETKNLQWALLVHLVGQARTGVPLEQWSTQLTPGAIHAVNLIGDCCDAFGAKIADCVTGLVSGHVAMLPPFAQADPGRPAAAAVSPVDLLTRENVQGVRVALGPQNFEPDFSLCFRHPDSIFPRNSNMN